MLLAAALLPLTLHPPRADPPTPQCWDCLKRLAEELPESNPQKDPSYEQGLTPGSVLPALAACSLDDGELPVLNQLIQVFTDALVGGGGPAYVQTHLEQIPQLTTEDRAKLNDGARQSLDTVLRHLIDHHCRLLLQSHFDEGGSRAWLLRMIALGQGSERHDSAEPPEAAWQDATLETVATLRIPPDTELRKDDIRYPDFVIYRVFRAKDQLLGIYLGHAPAFPDRRTAIETPVGPCTGLSSTTSDTGGNNRDTLLHVTGQNGFPTDLHFFYRNLSADAAHQADAIIAGFAPTPTTQCGKVSR